MSEFVIRDILEEPIKRVGFTISGNLQFSLLLVLWTEVLDLVVVGFGLSLGVSSTALVIDLVRRLVGGLGLVGVGKTISISFRKLETLGSMSDDAGEESENKEKSGELEFRKCLTGRVSSIGLAFLFGVLFTVGKSNLVLRGMIGVAGVVG